MELTPLIQIISAVEIAADPHSASFQQAIQYVHQLRENPSAWRSCLTIAIQLPPRPELVRLVCFDIVKNAMEKGFLEEQAVTLLKDDLLSFLKTIYDEGQSPSLAISPTIENKLAQVVTSLFIVSYVGSWKSCFDDLLYLCSTTQGNLTNARGTVFFLRFLNSLHDEIGDTLLSRSRGEQEQANRLKDFIRQRDVQKVAQSWQGIMRHWRTSHDLVADFCLKAVG